MNRLIYQQGVSLIELMIAMALGITLMAGSLQFIVGTKHTYDLNDDISRIQENGRIAMDIIVKDLQMAGYRHPKHGKIPNFFLRLCNNTAENEDTDSDNNASDACLLEGTANHSDRIAVQFDPPPDDSSETDCLGNTTVTFNSIIVNVYTIIKKNGISSLYCRGYDASKETWLGSGAQPLVDGIDNLQILYGVAGNNSNPLSVTKYISGNKLTSKDWPNLRSARVALLVSNGTNTAHAEKRLRKYRLLDSDELQFTDRQPRRIYSTTVKFNNYNLLQEAK